MMETDKKTVLFYDKRSVLKNIAVGTSVFCNNFKSLFLKGLPYILLLAVFTALLNMSYNPEFILQNILIFIVEAVFSIFANSLLLAFIAANMEYYSVYNKVPQYSLKEMFDLVMKKIWKALATIITNILLYTLIFAFIAFVSVEAKLTWDVAIILILVAFVACILLAIPLGLWEVEFNITDYRYGFSLANSFKLGYGNFVNSLVLLILICCALIVPMLLVASPRMILFLSENMFMQSKGMGDNVSLPGYFGALQGLSVFVISLVASVVNIVLFCIYFFFYGSLLNGADKKRAYKSEIEAEEIQ